MATKVRFQRSTKGENAEVIVGKALAYTTQATIALFEANAAEGEIGVYNTDTFALLGGAAALAAPANPAVITNAAGGALAAATYYYKIVAFNAAGNSAPSAEVSVATSGSTSSNQLSWNDVPGATSYRIYRGTGAGTEDHYQVSNDNTFLDAGAVGTVGTPPAATGGTIAPIAAGTNYTVAIKRDGQIFKTTKTAYDPNRTRRTAYIAPVKQVTTINFPAALMGYTPLANDYAGITTIETTPGNEPYPTIDWDQEVGNPAGVTMLTILTAIVARINNAKDIVQKDDGQQYSATIGTDGSGGQNVVITSFYFGQHFRVALRGILANGVVTYTTPFKQGVGDSDSVARIEAEGFIFAGVTTNYPYPGVPSEYGIPSSFVVNGLTYNTYQLDPLRVSKEPMPQAVHHAWPHIYIIVPVPVGGDAPTRAASSPDYILGTVLGFTLTP